MAYIPTGNDLELILQRKKCAFIKLEILNQSFQRIRTISGDTISASFSIDINSAITRTCSLSIIVKSDDLIVGNPNSKIWINTFVRVFCGIKNEITNKMNWYSQGIYAISTFDYTVSAETKQLNINCTDLVSYLDGSRRGQYVGRSPFIEKGEIIADTIKTLVKEIGGFTKFNIMDIGNYNADEDTGELYWANTVPYTLNFASTDTVWTMVDKLITLYPYWRAYFDIDGVFTVDKITNGEDEASLYSDTFISQLVIEEKLTNDFTQVKNKTSVWGKDEDCYGEYSDTNATSRFNVDGYGTFLNVLSKEQLITNEECEDWAEYENLKTCKLQDSLTLQLIDIPFMDVNQKFQYKSKTDNQIGQYVVQKISNDFLSGTMTINAYKVYKSTVGAFAEQLNTPVITSTNNGLILIIDITAVENARYYKVYKNNEYLGKTSSTTYTFGFSELQEGTYSFSVIACADGYRDSNGSNSVSVEITENYIICEDGTDLWQENSTKILLEE